MNRYEVIESLFEYAHRMCVNYEAITRTLFGAMRKMEAEADVTERTPLSESLKNVAWETYFRNTNFSSSKEFEEAVAMLETEPLPGIPSYGVLASLVGSETHDTFQQKADTALSVLGASGVHDWMVKHALECDGVTVVQDGDDAFVGALCLTKPVDMSVIGKLCMEHPEIAPILSMIVNSEG